ncbi:MAG: RNA methyltransferase [Natronospirillum sp.]|uniref:RNA methyltransferase n=1 Tax=Natronospirillum sp. TaxID=2812955 RepID=UPI0025F14F1C|nr:RNA methyltransferase [Natronospirillum sp.]MCH8550539.1 RNA methyltransferase [Natronospirillum sp.]
MSDPALPEDTLVTASVLQRIKIVMVETSLAANLGAAARAMKTMGLAQLVAVSPREPLDNESAIARASGAQELLLNAVCCDSLDEALQGCSLVIGTSARSRNLPWPMLSPVELPPIVQGVPEPGEIAILFGRERSGLTNEELARCHYHLHIPSNPDYSSLNIAAAVQVVAYELRRQLVGGDLDNEPHPSVPLATAEDLEGYFDHLQRVLVDIGFADPNNLRQLMLKLRRFYMRAQPEPVELNILRGIISQTEKSLIRARSGQDRAPDRSQDSH